MSSNFEVGLIINAPKAPDDSLDPPDVEFIDWATAREGRHMPPRLLEGVNEGARLRDDEDRQTTRAELRVPVGNNPAKQIQGNQGCGWKLGLFRRLSGNDKFAASCSKHHRRRLDLLTA